MLYSKKSSKLSRKTSVKKSGENFEGISGKNPSGNLVKFRIGFLGRFLVKLPVRILVNSSKIPVMEFSIKHNVVLLKLSS